MGTHCYYTNYHQFSVYSFIFPGIAAFILSICLESISSVESTNKGIGQLFTVGRFLKEQSNKNRRTNSTFGLNLF